MASPKPARVDWSGLPSAVLDVVSRRITNNADYVRFRAVCTSWRTATAARPRHLPCQLPWLALPAPEASDVCRFFSIPDGKIHSMQLRGSQGSHCCGSSFGWLVFLDTPIKFLFHYKDRGLKDIPSFFTGILGRTGSHDLLGMTPCTPRPSSTNKPNHTPDLNMPINFFLLNPLTCERIRLPPLNTRDVLEKLASEPDGGYVVWGRPGPDFSCGLEYIRRHFVNRFVLSSDPTSGDCVAMASFCHGATFAFCRPGGDSWTILTSPVSSFQDITFHKGGFYTVDTRLVLYVCDVGPRARIEEFPFSGNNRTGCPMDGVLVQGRRRRGQVIERVYLVESCGDLLMVLKTYDDVFAPSGEGEEEEKYHLVLDFEIYKLDLSVEPPRWVEVESLGDRILFLGPGHSLSLSAGDFLGECWGNCIYFSDYRPERYMAVHGGPDFGVFHFGDGHVERVSCCPVDTGSIWQPSLWITPSLRSTSW